MVDRNVGFSSVVGRLLLALDLPSESQLAAALGLKQSTWSTRKTRGSLPAEAIDALIERDQLNPEFIYRGTGPVHVDVDAGSWEASYRKRLKQCLVEYRPVLVSQGHKAADLKATADGKKEALPALLRDMRRFLTVDLNWLLTGEIATEVTPEERALLSAYRNAPVAGKEFIRQAAGMAAKRGHV